MDSSMGPPYSTFDSRIHAAFSRIHVVTHVEVPFSRARIYCCFLLDLILRWERYAVTASHCLMQLGSGGAVSHPAGSEQSPGGGRAPQIWHLEVQNTAQKLNSWFSFLVQNEFKRKNHPFDVPSKANDMFARILKS